MEMSRNEIKTKLQEVFELVMGREQTGLSFQEDTRLAEDMGLNSVGILYLVIATEEMFSLRFEDVGFNDFKTVGDVMDYLEKKSKV